MANYSQLKAAIADVIKTNGTKAITGQVLQDVLNSIVSVIGVNYTFAGIATPSTNPGTPDQNVFYIATQEGTYSNFNSIVLPDGISVLMWDGSWSGVDCSVGVEKRLNAGIQQIGYPAANGVYNSLSGTGKHIFFPVNSGDLIRVNEGAYYTYICYVKTYDFPVSGKSIDYSSVIGYTDRIEITENTCYTDVVPSDAKYIVVACSNDQFYDLDVLSVSINKKEVYIKDGFIGNQAYRITSPSIFPYKRRHKTGSTATSITGTRYTIGIELKAGDKIRVQSSYSPGVYVSGYTDFGNACLGANTGFLEEYDSDYSTNEIIGTATVDQIFSIKWKNSNNSAITDAQIEQMLASLTVEIESPGEGMLYDIDVLQKEVSGLTGIGKSKTLLYTGVLVQKSVSGNTFTDSTKTVTQKCALAVPYYNIKIDIKIPAGYRVGFKTGYSTTGWSLTWINDSGWLTNGQSYTFSGHNGQVYRTYFGKADGGALTVAEVTELINNGAIQLTYQSADGTVVERNSHSEHYLKALMRKFTGTLDNDDSLHKMPVFTHLSDIHGDYRRYDNFVEYSDFIEADAALVSGDLVPMCGAQDFTDYIDDVADKYNVMLLPCIGNHDARSNTTEQSQNSVLAHSIQKYGLSTPVGKDYPTYYYKDIASQSIRIVSLNLYCAGQKDTNEWRLTQDQMTWLVNTLASTPAGYGVVIMMHSPETTTNKDSNYGKFYQKFETGTIEYNNPYLPIRKIVDAFIGKTTFSGSFDEEITGGVTETITISADFTSVDASTEFICYVTGHRHRDCIGYVNGATNMQLMCNIALGFSLYGDSNYHYYAEETDVPRGGKGVVQDLFNVYIIDRATGNLRIARIGSNMNQDFEMRDYMTIPYKE